MPAPTLSLRDDFEDNATAAAWVAATTGSATVAETGGQARFTLPSATAGTHIARYTSRSSYDLTGGSFSINIQTMVATGVAASAFFQLYYINGNNTLQWVQLSGTLKAVSIVAGVSTDRYSAAWNASTYKYLRIRESGGNILWESSSNGTSWTTRATVSVGSLFAVTALYVDFGATCGNVASPGSLRLDDVNVILPALSTTWNWTNKAWSQRHRFRTITLAATGGQAYVAIADDINPDGSLLNPRYYSGPADAGRVLTLQASGAAAQAMAVNLPSDSRFELPVSDEGRIVRLYHRSISGATYVLREDYGRRIVEADDIVGETFRGLIFEGHQFVCEQLSALTASMGNLHMDGVIDIAAAGGIYQGSGSFASPTTGLKLYNLGGVGRLVGYNGGVEQAVFDTDGRLKAGAGDVILDANGITINDGFGGLNNIKWLDSGVGQIFALGGGFTSATTPDRSVAFVQCTAPVAGDDARLSIEAVTTGSSKNAAINLNSEGGGNSFMTFALDLATRFSIGTTGISTGYGINVGTATGAAAGQVRASGAIISTNTLLSEQTDAGTTNVVTGLTINHLSSATPAAGFGDAINFNAHSSTNTLRTMAQILAQWNVATDGSRGGYIRLVAYDSVGGREGIRVTATGSAPQLGFFASAGTTKQTLLGSRGGNAALAALLTALDGMGLINDSTSA